MPSVGYNSGSYNAGFYNDNADAFAALNRYREPLVHTYREGRRSMSRTYVYYATSELPAISLEWLDGDGNVLNLASATFRLIITPLDGGTATTKTSGMVGDDASPNVVIGWDTGELATIGVGTYTMRLEATVGGEARPWQPSSPDRLIIKEAA